jgi:hypothetical protein
MSVAIVQAIAAAEATAVASLAVTFGSATTGGNTFVACSAAFDADGVCPTPFTVTDSKSNSYTLARTQNFGVDGGNDACRLEQHYSAGGTAGASHEITSAPGDTVNMTLGIFELSGVDTTNPVADSGTGGTRSSGTAVSTGAVTPTQAGLGLAHMGYDSAAKTIALNWSGGNQELEIDENNDAQAQAIASKQFSAAGADTAAWTLNSAAQWGAQLVVYREAAVGGGGGKKRPGIRARGMLGNGTLLAA